MNETGSESLQFQLNGALPVGNVIVIEVQTRCYFGRGCHVLTWEITHFSDSKTALLDLFLQTVTCMDRDIQCR